MRLVASDTVRLVMRTDAAAGFGPISLAKVVIAPSLYASEIANALWKYVEGKVGSLELETALDRYEEAST